jgi:hypothetical protein
MNERSLAYSEQLISSMQRLRLVTPEKTGIIDSLLHPLAILLRLVLTRSGRLECNMILIDDEENIIQALDAGVQIHSLYYSAVKCSRSS